MMRIDGNLAELFVLKCAVITRALRATTSEIGTEPSRSPLESVTDTLVADFLSQVDFEVQRDAARMAEFYKIFYALENDIRGLIADTLAEAKGPNWWETAVPQAVRENVNRNREKEASEGLPPRSDRLIEYTTFGELSEVVKENWEVFAGIFSNATKSRVLRVLNRLNIIRGPIAHCNFLPEEESIRLKLAVRDWYTLMA